MKKEKPHKLSTISFLNSIKFSQKLNNFDYIKTIIKQNRNKLVFILLTNF